MTGEEKWVIFTYGLSKENCLQKLFFNKFIEMSCQQETIVSFKENLKLEPSFLAIAILHILYSVLRWFASTFKRTHWHCCRGYLLGQTWRSATMKQELNDVYGS